MEKGIFAKLTLATVLLLSLAFTGWAAVPAPPANQNLGIDDGVFNNLAEDQCRLCHGPNAEPDSPVAPEPTNVDRHHLRVDTLIGTDPTQDPSAAPCLDQDPATCVVGDVFECLSCHELVFNPVTGAFEFAEFRDCLQCHEQVAGQASVHHLTPDAEARDCVSCHGGIITNFDDGHFIPTYAPSLVTPWPSNKPNGGDPNPVLPTVEQGNCNYCHNTADNTSTPVTDPDSGVLVYRNAETHHSTGFILDGAKCVWCHNVLPGLNDAASIRRCEDCHGIDTLHNIQFDNVGDGVDPGAEAPWFGHIGNNSDCEGCHGFTAGAASAPGGGPLIPQVDSLSKASFIEGQSTDIVMTGQNFLNTITNPMDGSKIDLECTVVVTDASGYARTLKPTSITYGTMNVTIPADLPEGNYKLAAVKYGKYSNPMPCTVMTQPEIYSADLAADGTITINGNGFSAMPPVIDGLGVAVEGKAANTLSWGDDRIVAKLPGANCDQTVTVSSSFGSVSDVLVGECNPDATAEAPVIDRCNRTRSRTGRILTLYGDNFGTDGGQVMVGSMEAETTLWTDGKVKFRVPADKRGYKMINVIVNGQTSNQVKFYKR